MSILSEISREFSSDVRLRGKDYFRRGTVEIVESDGNHLHAIVDGTELYDVHIEWDKKGIRGGCSCPYAQDHGPCKHLWATLLKAERDGLLKERDSVLMADGFDAVAELLDGLLRTKTRKVKSTVHSNDRTSSHSPSPPWKRHLSSLREAMKQASHSANIGKDWPQDKRLAYVIRISDSIHRNQALTLSLMTQSLYRGQWSSPKPARIAHNQLAALAEEDRIILQMLSGLGWGSYYAGAGDTYLRGEFTMRGHDFDLILRRICETGRCFIHDDDEQHTDLTPLLWDDGPAWELWLKFDHNETDDRYTLNADLRRGDERMDIRTPQLLLADGLLIAGAKVARLNHFGAFVLVGEFRHSERKISVAAAQMPQMFSELFSMPSIPRVDFPPELQVQTLAPTMHPRLKISAPPKQEYGDERLIGELSYDYDGRIIPETGKMPITFDPETRTLLRRNTAAEAAAASRLDELSFKLQWGYDSQGHRRRLSPKKLNKVVLNLCAQGWHVEAEGKLYRQPGEFKLAVKSGIDWFELDGKMEFDGSSASLPKLLAALRRGEKTVQLDDGTMGVLPEQWLRQYGLLARTAKEVDGEIRFSRRQIGLLDAILSTVPQATSDAVFEQARQELLRFQGVAPVDPAAGFIGQLRPYQREGLGWLGFLNRFGFGGCLADDMGLGKTIQVLALLEARRQHGKPSLVVVPRSLIFNWIEEAKRFTPQLRVLDHSGVGRARSTDHFKQYDLILTTYGTLRLDAVFMKDCAFDYAILDEAQAIKNSSSESAKAARLISADHRLVLSGTPIQNHLGELWSLFEFLNPGMLGGANVFKTTGAGSQIVEKEGRELLSRALRPFILRRTKQQVATDLPEKTEQTLWCDLEPEQRKHYDELRDHYRTSLMQRIATEGINKAKIHVLEALLRLRQAACHPGLIDKSRINESSAKLDVLLPQLAEVMEENHKVLVFSQFTSMLAIVKKHLDKKKIEYEYLDGKTKDRQAKVERFQNDEKCKLFLISLKAGGLGLNLTAAEYVYLLDPWWNPAVESQAIDRAHRIGQTRNVFAYRIIARGTVEEKVLELQSRKKDLADMIINADNSLIGKLGREDLELLLS